MRQRQGDDSRGNGWAMLGCGRTGCWKLPAEQSDACLQPSTGTLPHCARLVGREGVCREHVSCYREAGNSAAARLCSRSATFGSCTMLNKVPASASRPLPLGLVVRTVTRQVRCRGRAEHQMHMRHVLGKGGTATPAHSASALSRDAQSAAAAHSWLQQRSASLPTPHQVEICIVCAQSWPVCYAVLAPSCSQMRTDTIRDQWCPATPGIYVMWSFNLAAAQMGLSSYVHSPFAP